MISNKKLVVVMPAYNAAKTLGQTFELLPMDVVDEIILVDDANDAVTAGLLKAWAKSKGRPIHFDGRAAVILSSA